MNEDALVAAPNHHRLLFENDAVRVLETLIPAGETAPLHTHRWPGVNVIIETSEVVRRGSSGEITFDSRDLAVPFQPGEARWTDPLPLHTLENVGAGVLRVITVELKSQAPDG